MRPPHETRLEFTQHEDREHSQALLGILISEPDQWDTVAELLTDDLFDCSHLSAVCWRAVRQARATQTPSDGMVHEVSRLMQKESTSPISKKSPGEVRAMVEGWTFKGVPSLVRFHTDKLIEASKHRRWHRLSKELERASFQRDLTRCVAIVKMMEDITDGPQVSRVVTLAEAAQQHAHQLREVYEGKKARFYTGIPIFDKTINKASGGGLMGGQLGIVGGRTSSGKTTLAVFTCLEVAQRQPSAHPHIFSLELHPRDLAAKAISREKKIKGIAESRLRWESSQRAADSLATGLGQRITIREAVESAAVLGAASRRARAGANLFVLDHLHRIKVTDPNLLRHELGNFAKGIRDHAKRYDVPWLVAAQLKRESLTSRHGPSLGDISESDIVGQEADWVVNIWYPEVKDRTRCKLKAVKNRTGPEESRMMGVDWNAQSFFVDGVG